MGFMDTLTEIDFMMEWIKKLDLVVLYDKAKDYE